MIIRQEIELGETRLILRYLGKNKWQVEEDCEMKLPIVGSKIVIRKGFKTDLASIPRIAYSLFPRSVKYNLAGTIHDYLYDSGKFKRKMCDKIFREILKLSGVKKRRYDKMYWAVRIFGGRFYKK